VILRISDEMKSNTAVIFLDSIVFRSNTWTF